VSGLADGQQARATVTVNPTLFDDTIIANVQGIATFSFGVPADLPAGSVLTVTIEGLDGTDVAFATLTVQAAASDGDPADSDTADGTSNEAEDAADSGAAAETATAATTGALATTGQPIGMLLAIGLLTLAFGAALSRQSRTARVGRT
jgi:hypothetical protein